MKRVYLALPASDAMEAAIRKRLKRKKLAKQLEIVDELESAQVVVTSSDDIGTLPERLPASVQLLQLIDCGGGQRYRDAPNLTISNATGLFDTGVATAAFFVTLHAASEIRQEDSDEPLQLGIIGLGNLARELLDVMVEAFGGLIGKPLGRHLRFNRIVICDIRTPGQGLMQDLGRRFAAYDVSVRRVSLDQLLSTSDVVFVAAHHGPTADPLLGDREVRLLDPNSRVIDVSEKGVVDPSAFKRDLRGAPTPVYVSFDDVPRAPFAAKGIFIDVPPKFIAKLVGLHLRRFDKGESIPTVEHVDFPSAGDPAFWSSRMSPRE